MVAIMSKREKIILAVMALTIVYGAYSFFAEPQRYAQMPSPTESKLEAFHKFISNVANLTKDGLSEIDAYIIEHISDQWTKDPLLNITRDVKIGDQSEVIKSLDIIYTGYLEMGPKRMAIINGMEYESGEPLAKGGHRVGLIYPDRVVIVTRESNQEVAVPLVESQ